VAIVCLGWGSLIWSPRSLPVKGAWHEDGPRLPIEFSRQARDGRITLAITPGAPLIPVLWTELAVDSLHDAVSELGHREGIAPEYWLADVGVWHPGLTLDQDRADTIAAWAEPRGFDGVVWTALPPGFQLAPGTVPSVGKILTYLKALTGEARIRAEEYIRNAPAQTRTAYRTEIEKVLGWTPA
jgi:hypothetical protein